MPSPAVVATVNNTPFGTGLGSQTHVVYAPNSGVWWAFWLDSSDLTTLQCAYGNSTSWTAATSLTLAANHDSDGRRFNVRIDSIAGIDVLHVARVLGTTPFTVYHARAILSGTTITWGAETDTGVVSTSASAFGVSITLDSNNVPIISYTGASGLSVIRATNADLGTSWVDGWGAPTTLAADASESTTVIPFASGVLVALGDNDAVTPNWTNLDWSKYTGTWSIAASVRGSNLVTAEPISDWAWAATATDVLVLYRTGVKTFEGRDFNGTSWSALTNLGSTPINTVVGSGVAVATDGTSLWAFCLGNTDDVYYNRLNHIGGAWTGWIALGLPGATRTGLGAYQNVASNTIVLYWTEGATSPYTFVTYPLNTQVPAVPTDLDCTAQNGQLTVRWNAPLYVGASAISSYIVHLTAPGFPLGFAATQITPDGNTLTATFTGLTNGRTYTATVLATNSSGNSDATAGVLCTPYFSPDGSGPGAGFSGRMWGGAEASTPPGYVWGNIGAPGGDWNRWQMLGQYRPQLAFQSPNPPFPLLTGVIMAGGLQLGDMTIGSAAALLLPGAAGLTLDTLTVGSQAGFSTAAIALTTGTMTIGSVAAEQFTATIALTLGTLTIGAQASYSTASLSLQLGTMLLASGAALIIPSALALTLGTLTLVAQGVSSRASIALVLGDVTVNAAATSVIAALALTVGTLTVSTAAAVRIPAAVALTVGTLTVAAASSYTTASLALTLGDFTLAVAATLSIPAAVALTLGTLTVAGATGYSTVSTSLVLPDMLIGAAGNLILAAALALQLSAMVVSGASVFTTGTTASVNLTLADMSTIATGTSTTAALALNYSSMTVAGTVRSITPTALALTLASMIVASSATLTIPAGTSLQLDDMLIGAAAAVVLQAAVALLQDDFNVTAAGTVFLAALGLHLADFLVHGSTGLTKAALDLTLTSFIISGVLRRHIPLLRCTLTDAPTATLSVLDLPSGILTLFDRPAAQMRIAAAIGAAIGVDSSPAALVQLQDTEA